MGLTAPVLATIVTATTATIATTATTAAAIIPRTTAIATITARLAFAWRTCVFQLLTGFLVDDTHRQANLATLVDLEDLDLYFLAF